MREKWPKLADVGREPFRVFFPAGVLAGIIGVALWPLYFSGLSTFYPGQAHARIMADGLFGAFIFGFLGTAMPRLLSVPWFGASNVFLLLTLHSAMVLAYAAKKIFWGDVLFLVLLLTFLTLMLRRLKRRQDTAPSGFVLVGLAFLCALAGGIIAVLEPRMDEAASAYWIPLQHRLSYQAFVLLPILGIGPFLLPRFFGQPSRHDFPGSLNPSAAWKKKAAWAFGAGALIIGTLFVEAEGFVRTAHALRFFTVLIYLLIEFPFARAPKVTNALGASLRIAFTALVSGFILIAFFPAFRTGLLHLTLIGGFAVIPFTVATRVLFGHSGNLEKLTGRNYWLFAAVGLMLFGMATRISGDFWPKIISSHYSYGAIVWIAGALLWSWHALPRALEIEAE